MCIRDSICTIALNIEGAWIKKSNGAGPTSYEAVKGGLSDAFKRAATMWGIGSYLQEMQTQFVYEVKQSRNKLVIDEQAAMPKPVSYTHLIKNHELQFFHVLHKLKKKGRLFLKKTSF